MSKKKFNSSKECKAYNDVIRDLHYHAIQLVVFSLTMTDKEKIKYLKILCKDNEK